MQENKVWKLCKKIYENAESKTELVEKYNDYWNGDLNKNKKVFSDQTKTAFNVIEPIVETKLKAMLDAQITLAVVPKINSFANLRTIKDHQAVADIMHEELLNILKRNKMDTLNEIVARFGIIGGFGVVQTIWDDNEGNLGEIKIKQIQSEKFRWSKDADCVEDSSFFGYSFTMSTNEVKNKYAKNKNGEFNIELCKKIDAIAENKFSKEEKGTIKGVVNYKTSNGSGQLYSYGDNVDGICAGKNVNLVCLFLVDDSFYAPESNDNNDEKKFKAEQLVMYPNGRMIIFSMNEKEQLILEDVALPKSYNSLGNISIFNPIKWGGIAGKGEVENLIETQNRIDGLYNKYRDALENDLTFFAIQKNEEIALDDLVAHPIMYMKPNDMTPVSISNGGIEKAEQALSMIERLEKHAAKMARVNETMIYGYRQTGTTSGDQVQMLQESPLADIRSMQRNFNTFYLDIGNKILELIKHNYTTDRLIKLTTGLNDASFAKLQQNAIDGKQELVLLNEAGEAIKTIKIGEDWEFCVEVSSGTEVPRTRREQAVLMDVLIDKGILKINDIDMIEQYLRAQDIPNYRILVKLLRDKQEQAEKIAQNPESRNWKEVMKNPDIAKALSEFMKSIGGYQKAKQQILSEIGLDSTPGKLDDTPVEDLTSQSEVAQVATISPTIISNNQEMIRIGRNAAIAEKLSDIMK